jgi:hypothetical protein
MQTSSDPSGAGGARHDPGAASGATPQPDAVPAAGEGLAPDLDVDGSGREVPDQDVLDGGEEGDVVAVEPPD